MISIRVDISDFGRVTALMSRLSGQGRAQLNRVGANAAAAKVQRHIHGYARGKHFTAASLAASPTGHYEKGAAAVTANSSADIAEVIVPIPGISRAFHDIVLTTPTRRGKNFITIPKHAAAYGHTVAELKMRGWKIFRPGKKKVLLGYRNKGEKPVILFSLANDVRQRQDPRLLPTKAELGAVFAGSVKREIDRIMRKAGRA